MLQEQVSRCFVERNMIWWANLYKSIVRPIELEQQLAGGPWLYGRDQFQVLNHGKGISLTPEYSALGIEARPPESVRGPCLPGSFVKHMLCVFKRTRSETKLRAFILFWASFACWRGRHGVSAPLLCVCARNCPTNSILQHCVLVFWVLFSLVLLVFSCENCGALCGLGSHPSFARVH